MDSKQLTEDPETGPIILVDNNMIQHFLNKEVDARMGSLLQEIQQVGAVLAVSQIVVYEALKAIIFNDAKYREVSAFFEEYLVRYPVSEEVLVECARVHEIYGSNEHTKAHRGSFSTEDIIIATTAMMLGAYVMTCDRTS